ncbi:MAG: DNA mismatch repair protein MutH, partial [Myxococcota bacterium]
MRPAAGWSEAPSHGIAMPVTVGPIHPPKTETELFGRARALAGRRLGDLATAIGWKCPADQKRHKGWTGTLIEAHLGATAGSRSAPDFERIGVELKTVPISARGTPSESTFVATTIMCDFGDLSWESSRVRHKLARVLWVPVQADPAIAMADRRIGSPLLWSATPEEEAVLKADWSELMDRVRMGQVDTISAREGVHLQLRPKGASSRSRVWGIDENGHRYQTLPRGWYLRAGFTAALLARNFHITRPA